MGFDAASIVEITRTAGVAQGTFYTYFPHKEAAFIALVHSLAEQLTEAVRVAAQDAPTWMERERASLRAFFRFTAEHRSLYRIIRQAEFVDEELYRAYYRRIAAGYARSIRTAVRQGELRDLDVDTLAWSLMGVADFLGMRWVLWEGREPPDAVIDAALDLLRAGVQLTGNGEPA